MAEEKVAFCCEARLYWQCDTSLCLAAAPSSARLILEKHVDTSNASAVPIKSLA